jgi:hypothetical protein
VVWMRRVVWLIALLAGAFLIFRAIVEPFVIDTDDPATYRNDWGGPSLVGVLAVHMVPGLLAAALMIAAFVRHRRARQRRRDA